MALRPSDQWTAAGFEPTAFTTLACWKAGTLTNWATSYITSCILSGLVLPITRAMIYDRSCFQITNQEKSLELPETLTQAGWYETALLAIENGDKNMATRCDVSLNLNGEKCKTEWVTLYLQDLSLVTFLISADVITHTSRALVVFWGHSYYTSMVASNNKTFVVVYAVPCPPNGLPVPRALIPDDYF